VSLRLRIALALAVLAALATTAVGVASYRTTRERLYDEVDRSLTEVVTLLPRNSRGEISGLPVRGPLALYEAQVIGPDGTVRLTTFPVPVPADDAARSVIGQPRSMERSTVSVDGDPYRVSSLGLPNGAVQIARPLAETQRVLASLRARTFLIVVLVAAVAALVGWLVAGRATASLRRLTKAAETVGATGRLDVDVPAEGGDEVGRLGSAFASMLDALDRSRAEQRRLVQDAGHELRTPLTSLRTNLSVLRRHPDLPAEQRAQVLDDLHAVTEQLVGLVEEIVAAATGDLDDEPRVRTSLGALVEEVVERHRRRTARTITCAADESTVEVQVAAVQRAVSNLLDNALKFDTSGGPIEVRVVEGRVDVADRGPGIPAADGDLIFARFHRSAEARTLPGSGLGLAIVREMAIRHGGTVHAEDRPDGGALVGFTLPVVAPWSPPLT
jgi:two-component system sensor histidine kinase MprB